jgi:hypothetical protein
MEGRFCINKSFKELFISSRYILKFVGIKILRTGWVPVAHAYIPSYSRGTELENHGLKPI